MTALFRVSWRTRAALFLVLTLAVVFSCATALHVFASGSLVQVSSDPYTNSTSQHQTEVEPDTFAHGSTIVSAFQVGRFYDGGSSNIGWATSTNDGSTWTHGFLPGTTPYSTPTGPYARLSDATVAYDAAHNTWMIASLALQASSGGTPYGAAIIVNLSTDGGLTWGNPVVVKATTVSGQYDKDWIVCDTTSTSPYYGHCYAEWDNNGNSNLILMSTSTDGGNTWGAPLTTGNRATGIGGQPLVQPNGTVIVPISDAYQAHILSFTSTNGGTSWSNTITVAAVHVHNEGGSLRSSPLPSAEMNSGGKVFVVWQDCRFETNCTANDIVMTTSSSGTSWTKVKRIPIDGVGSGVDHFIPGIAVDRKTSGSTTHIGLAYYYYPVSSCTTATCQLEVGYVSSTNGGTSWSALTQLAGPVYVGWLANTDQGYMVGDYISTSFVQGKAFPAFAVASAPNGGPFQEATYSVSSGLSIVGGTRTSNNDHEVYTATQSTLSKPTTAH